MLPNFQRIDLKRIITLVLGIHVPKSNFLNLNRIKLTDDRYT